VCVFFTASSLDVNNSINFVSILPFGMAEQPKYEQACVVQGMVEQMESGQMSSDDHTSMPWQLVADTTVARIMADEGCVFVNLTGMPFSTHKMLLEHTFVVGNMVHWVYGHRSFPYVKLIIRPVPEDTMQLVLDLKLESSTSIHACVRGLDGQPVVRTDFPTSVPLTVSWLKTIVRGLLLGQGRSTFAKLEVYFQGSDVEADGLAARKLLWNPSWQLPLGQFNVQSRRCSRKSAPAHPTMDYWLARGR
jgi:hypothetical protein